MASAASVSESMQVSIVLHSQPNVNHGPHSPLPARTPQTAVGYCKQVMLVMTASGMEMCMTFEQIYQVLILQYLGVPLSLVSLNGVICGLASMAIIPVVGFVTDRGSNPKRRKMVSLFVGMAAFQVGILILLVSGVVKMAVLKGVLLNVDTTPPLSTPAALVTPDAAAVYDKSLLLNKTSPNELRPDWSHINETTTLEEHRTHQDTGLPVTAYLAICGFAFVDIGYDSTMPLSRAYILESVPRFQHISLLVMATLVQAASGTLFSLLGVLDISDSLGQAFQVDGTSAVLVFLCTLLFIAVTGGFISTTLTGYFLTKDSMYTKLQAPQINTASRKTPEIRRRKRLRSYRPHIYRSDSPDASKSPLLHGDNPAHIYTATNKNASFTASNVSFEDDHKSRRVNDSYNLHASLSVDGKPFGDARQPAHASPVPELDESDLHGNSLLVSHNSQTSGLKESKPPGEAATRGTETPTCQSHPNKDGVKSRMKKRLIILSASTFFTFGASISFLYYAANAVTLGIFHGDPRALPGSEGQHLYDTGLRTAALGNLSFYILFTITSMINSKLIEIAGEKVLFIVFHLLFIIPLVALVSMRCLEAYFVTVVMVGVFRHTVYTLPFVMANKITQDTGDNLEADTGKSNLGKTMSLIGFLIPAHYIIISAIMGPVFEATGNVWVPLMYSLACACVSVLIFCLMFLVK